MQNSAKPELVCIGNAIVDVFARVDENIEAILKLDPAARHVDYETISEILVTLSNPVLSSGGGSANVAKIAALLGISSAFIGTVGSRRPAQAAKPDAGKTPRGSDADKRDTPKISDSLGSKFEEELRQAGVVPVLNQADIPTGVCAVLQKDNGESIIAASPSAALRLRKEDIPEDMIREAKAVVLDGYMLGRKELVTQILVYAERWGTAAALDVGSEAIAAAYAETIIQYCKEYPIILFMNEAESLALYEALHKDGAAAGAKSAGANETGRRIRRAYSYFKGLTEDEIFPIIAVKRGPKGAVVFAGGSMFREETLALIPLETTGAGDAFCAGFMAQWIRDRTFPECAAFGNRVAREVLNVPGTKINRKKMKNLARDLKR